MQSKLRCSTKGRKCLESVESRCSCCKNEPDPRASTPGTDDAFRESFDVGIAAIAKVTKREVRKPPALSESYDHGRMKIKIPPRSRLSSRIHSPFGSDDIPDVFDSVTEFAACYAGTQAIVADADGVVFELIRKVVLSFGHGPNEDANTLFRTQVFYVVSDAYDFGVEAKGYFSTIWRKMISDWILNYFEQFFLRICRTN